MVNNDTARNQLEEMLLEVNATLEDVNMGNDAKFVAAKKLKLQQFLRSEKSKTCLKLLISSFLVSKFSSQFCLILAW